MQNHFQPYMITSIHSSIYPRTGEITFTLGRRELCTHLKTAALRLSCVAILLELDEIPGGIDEALKTLEAIAEFHTDVPTNKQVNKGKTTMPDEIDFDKNQQPSNNGKRMSVTLSQDEAEMLEWLATEQRITQKEAIRKAIALEAYLYKERKAGSKILFHTNDGQVREVIFR